MKPILSIIGKIKYILRLIKATPRYRLIIFLQFISGAASFFGLPMLVPVLNYMGSAETGQTEGYLGPLNNIFLSFGVEPGFYSILFAASILILTGQSLIFISSLIANNAQVDLSKKYRDDLFKSYSRVDWLWLLNSRSGEMNYSVVKETDMAAVGHLNAQRVLIYAVQVAILMCVTFKLSAAISLTAVAVYGILTFLSTLNSSFVLRLAEKYNEKFKKLSNDVNVLQQNKKFFKTSLLNEKSTQGIFTGIDSLAVITKRQNVHIEMQRTFNLIVTFLFLVSLMAFHVQLNLQYSTLLLILVIFLRIAPQFTMLTAAYVVLDANIPMHKSLHRRLKDLQDNYERNGTKTYGAGDEIRFDQVEFTYPNGEKIFDKVNLTIRPKQTTAVIGSSGVGKSTLLDLLLRLLNPDAGKIYYGNIPHDELDRNSVRGQVAYVSQETTLVDGTLRDNLVIGADEISDEKFTEVLKKVGLEETVHKLPNGLDTEVGENGIKLSGGQRQRVALARALFTDPKILILDEATSSLDSQTEQTIQETIKNLSKDFTVVIVTHKLSAVRFADTIYVLENGQVCESGNYDKLMAQKGKFAFFDSLQK